MKSDNPLFASSAALARVTLFSIRAAIASETSIFLFKTSSVSDLKTSLKSSLKLFLEPFDS